MRLEKIKLAGFKSFVDPTTLPLPGNLVGIVGPNGCGKSNLIDAVRWVMGESSAKHLRGDTMADVIFNGSSTRRPVGLASVELVFDNGEGKAPGEFAKYREISLKRQVTRDGQSTYFLNGSRCRRKDITDLFLGTGLGARSYAIIEQGMISRLIEAKPQELREIIEEAAGISRYKERRHETRQRMGHTQENLDRLQDVRDEVAKQLESLKRQARKAEKYTALKQEERSCKEQLLALRWRKYDQALQAHQASLAECEQAFRACHGEEQRLEAALDARRGQQDKLQRHLAEQQGEYYELGAEASRLDQALKHARKTRDNLLQEGERLGEEQEQARRDLEHDRRELDETRAQAAETAWQLEQAGLDETEAARMREEASLAVGAARQEFERLNGEMQRCRSQAEIQQSRLRQMEQQERQLRIRRERLQRERDELEEDLDAEGLEELHEEAAELETGRAELQASLQQSQEAIRAGRERAKSCQEELNTLRAEAHRNQGKISSLETLQEHAMGKDRAGLQRWLGQQALDRAGRLAEYLDVQSGWETAVETVLGPHLEALCVESAAPHLAQLDGLAGESLGLFEMENPHPNPLPQREEVAANLLGYVRSPWNLHPLLGSVYCAEDLDAAHALSRRLADHESVVTPDGVRLGPGWLSVHKPDDGKAGMIRREKELRALKALRADLAERTGILEAEWAAAEASMRGAEQERDRLQGEDRRLAAELSRVKSALSAATARAEQAGKRLRQVEFELDDLGGQAGEQAEERGEARTLLLEAEDRLAGLEPKAEQAASRRGEAEARLQEAEAALRAARERRNGLASRLESLKSAEALTGKHLERAQSQYQQAQGRLEQLQTRLEENAAPSEEEQTRLDGLLERRAQAERALTELRRHSGEGEAEIRRLSEARLRNECELEAVKQRLEQIKLDLQANEVRRQAVQEQFDELEADPHTALAGLPEKAEEKAWQQRVAELGEEIGRLGAVNLTAMEEYLAQEERMKFLDEQHKDLSESLATLTEAIEKIDRECRTRFKETFDRVNAGLQRMFPKLFGGGQASLDLTERDLLESGVGITARPPGKRNSSIHLLSGGEKALTAVALVFAIFELNPAPFCLLDEVDAPLDDANVGRFGELVKEMSGKVQFLFISHNKATMEIAQHLAGVTMKEPGVSRIVAVDIDAAVELAAA